MPPPPKKSNKSPTLGSVIPITPSTPIPSSSPVVERSEVKGSGGKPKSPRQFSHDEVSRRAYEIYANRGYTPGDQNADWLEAERQLKAGL